MFDETFVFQIRELCLPFLRVASVLRNHLYGDQLPEISTVDEEYGSLVEYLKLMDRAISTKSAIIRAWFTEFKGFVTSSSRSSTMVHTLLTANLNVDWCQPKLLPLPYEYKDVFQVGRNDFGTCFLDNVLN